MSARLEATLLSAGDLFAEAGTSYEIPIYQRNYAWRNKQIDQLIDDVWAAAQDPNADGYFIGNLIVASKSPAAESKSLVYEVVDGQQRLTTVFMLFQRLGIDREAKLTYASRRAATDALTRLDLSDDDEGSGILTGYKAIDARMSQLSHSPDELATFTSFLTDKVQLVRAVLPASTDLNKYFEIMNTRGRQLAQVDIVKARLMSFLRSDASDVEDQRACMAWIWDACTEVDSYIQLSLARGDTALRSRIFGESWDRLQVSSFGELIPLRPHTVATTTMRSAPLSLRDAISMYAQVPERASGDDEIAGRFETPIRFPTLLLHALAIISADRDDESDNDRDLDDSKLILRFQDEFANRSDIERSEHAKKFVETLFRCKFVLDTCILKREFTSTNGEDGAWSLKRLVRGESVVRQSGRAKVDARFPSAFGSTPDESDEGPADDSTRNVLLLQSLLRVTYTSPRTMHWITSILRMPIGDGKMTRAQTAEAIETTLRSYIRKKVRQSLPGDDGPTGFSIQRIVFTYLDYLLARGASPRLSEDPGFVFAFRNSVEHFFPQHADVGDDGGDAVSGTDPELNMFGNLALVSVSANSKFSNALPLAKTAKTREIGQSKKLELMARVTKAAGYWDRESIKLHDTEMLGLLRADLELAGLDDSANS
ncbi:DUF262 domain-containing protein [Rhodococcoides fascians]|uniref:DUF262 domain-containing protein n=1 Tax=Rhodococcoides fascians TaxID=1828 RepID=UPI001D7515A0|nr:DUF262 domain-containing protein [Rhodococcus fascians]CAH0230549.1 hypothetical protein SRABI91_02627 [Rhodococcus fascians]